MHKSGRGRESTLRFWQQHTLILAKGDNKNVFLVCVFTRCDELNKETTKRPCSLPPFTKKHTHHLPLPTSASGNWLKRQKMIPAKIKFKISCWVIEIKSLIKSFGSTNNVLWVGLSKQIQRLKTFPVWQEQGTQEGQRIGKLHL